MSPSRVSSELLQSVPSSIPTGNISEVDPRISPGVPSGFPAGVFCFPAGIGVPAGITIL